MNGLRMLTKEEQAEYDDHKRQCNLLEEIRNEMSDRREHKFRIYDIMGRLIIVDFTSHEMKWYDSITDKTLRKMMNVMLGLYGCRLRKYTGNEYLAWGYLKNEKPGGDDTMCGPTVLGVIDDEPADVLNDRWIDGMFWETD